MKVLPREYYQDDDVVRLSRALLGKVLCTDIDGRLTKVIITETEAYAGVTDRASHAYGDRRTRRTEPIYAAGGTAYVYLCYGIHHMFNVVTAAAETPHAILIRAGAALTGLDVMLARREKASADKTLLAGPGSLGKALGITTALTGTSLLDGPIWLEDHGVAIDPADVSVGPRIGIDYAGEDAALPYRFVVDAPTLDVSQWVSD